MNEQFSNNILDYLAFDHLKIKLSKSYNITLAS